MDFATFKKKYSMYIALAVVFGMMLLYQWQGARQVIAGVVDIVIGPFAALGLPFFALVLILATITGFYSALIQKYTMNYEKMNENQEKMKEFNKKFREAQASGDEKLIKKMQARQQQMMAEQMETTKDQFKPMAYILVLTVPVFFWLIEHIPTKEVALADPTLSTAIVIPFGGLTTYFDVYLGFFPFWILWYLVCSLIMSQIIRKTLNIGGV